MCEYGSDFVESAIAQTSESPWSRKNRPFKELQRERRFLFNRRMGDVCFGVTATAATLCSSCVVCGNTAYWFALLPVTVTLERR